ncbi:MAG TPA: 2-hydroxycarboxylate transporter family protein [Clostridium sp.]|uniref:2-hydroxycarboxylate transporter family protein n=1 Tax=Clostridium sp. TaxID=1506 RepID=UPI002F9299AC
MQSDVNVQPKKPQSLFSKFITLKIGVVPLPLYLVIACIIFTASINKKLPADMIGGFATIMIMGIFLGELGKKIPILKNIGGPAILCLFIPSYMLYAHILNPTSVKAITAVMKTSNFLYLYISVLVAGSILGMNRKILIKGFTRMFVPLIVGTIAAIAAGILVGLAFGYTPYRTFFFIVMPIVAGGIGEGILPLTLSYSQILQQGQQVFVAQMIPAALLGNVIAIVSAGLLKRLGEKKPELTGNGVLVKSGNDDMIDTTEEKSIDLSLMGAGLLIACTLFIFGSLASKFIPIPGPVIMIFSAALLKVLKLMPEKMEQGANQLYKFISGSLTFPLMIGLGVLFVPWADLVHAITPSYVAICLSTVLAMIASGYFVGKYVNMYPVDAAIVTSCHSGLGGTGDVAILSASNRMELMPFAQISTRIGGASMVVVAALLMKFLS